MTGVPPATARGHPRNLPRLRGCPGAVAGAGQVVVQTKVAEPVAPAGSFAVTVTV